MLNTSVSSELINAVRSLLINEGVAAAWFRNLYVDHPSGTIRDKARCSRIDSLSLNDQATVIARGEESWWIAIEAYPLHYPDHDRELVKALDSTKSRLGVLK